MAGRPTAGDRGRHEDIFAVLELAFGLAMLIGFVGLLLLPAGLRVLTELPWTIGLPHSLPGFGINPHHLAEARHAPALVVLGGCAGLAVCYRWLQSRRRG
jgi:hypothetical protein